MEFTYFCVCIHFWSNTARMCVMSIHAYSLISLTFFSRSFFDSYNHYRLYLLHTESTPNLIRSIWIFFSRSLLSLFHSLCMHTRLVNIYNSDRFERGLNLAFYRESIHKYERLQNCSLAVFSSFRVFFALCLIRSNINILLSSRECYVNLPCFFPLLLLLLAFVCMRSVLDVIHFTACYGLLINVRTRSNTLKMLLPER